MTFYCSVVYSCIPFMPFTALPRRLNSAVFSGIVCRVYSESVIFFVVPFFQDFGMCSSKVGFPCYYFVFFFVTVRTACFLSYSCIDYSIPLMTFFALPPYFISAFSCNFIRIKTDFIIFFVIPFF